MSLSVLDALPPLPQVESLKRLAAILWSQEEVAALWLGGSFACGLADEFSDVDLRVAVRPAAAEAWRRPDLARRLFGDEVVGSRLFPLGPEGFLHHFALSSGDIFDLWVQDTEQTPLSETVLVLAGRDDDFLRRLSDTRSPPVAPSPPADPLTLQEVVTGFWIDTLKHRKVLNRGLDLVAQTGIGLERALLLRLWYVLAAGRDGDAKHLTIHSLTHVARVVAEAQGRRGLEITGLPLTNREEVYQAIETNREEVSRVGRQLAQMFGFEYPAAVEETARRTWHQYREGGR